MAPSFTIVRYGDFERCLELHQMGLERAVFRRGGEWGKPLGFMWSQLEGGVFNWREPAAAEPIRTVAGTARPRAVPATQGDVTLGTGFELRRRKGDRELRAVCSLQTHQLGWEVVLEVNGLLSRSQVCRSRDEVRDVCEQWRAVMVEAGWRE